MRILVISNLYPSPTTTTGDIVLTEMWGKRYRDRGHKVHIISSVHNRRVLLIDIPTKWSLHSKQPETDVSANS
ncbi:MAG: hypothetical protein WCL39_07275 [Armatimonadota bacterium]